MKTHYEFNAAILVNQNQPLVVDRVVFDKTLDIGQVLVKVHFSGICGSQLGEISGVKGPDRWLPHLLGHEGSGTVLDVGPGVSNVAIGDTVVLHWRKGVGIQSAPPQFTWNNKTVNAGWVTTFNEMAVVSENRITKIDTDTNLATLPLFGCAVTTGFGTIVNVAKVKIGHSVVVYGAGGVGLSMVQAASMSSAFPIIAVDLHDNRLQLAKKFGATHTINSNAVCVKEAIAKIVNEQKLDVFIDNTGLPNVIELGYQVTATDGRVVLVGVPRAEANVNLHSLPLHFGKEIIGSEGGDTRPEIDIPRYLRLYEDGRLKLDELQTKKFSLFDINDAIQEIRDGSIAGRVLIEM